ncbi:MBOAT family O-acyltransferase [Mucilaginibacter sp. dw_454]|uniref:MBOAT family O-acyltransferase n=1 Tax=Mucilaginibacter sp. dw_454 TaxID=2720079 RepID=UPI001BD43E05|nr:MBOAT family O-acyltransferase [Mucilaginibacter sp. dw_454]
MLFTSLTFLAFFTVFFICYWLIFTTVRAQNLFLLISSCIFYGWFSWPFLLLLLGSSAFNYWLGIGIGHTKDEKRRRLLLWIGLFQGIGCLFIFKYYNFFAQSAGATFHFRPDAFLLHVILPLGISFYTFRTLSYILDIYNEKLAPTNNWVSFFTYVSFFPCLISGPIDKPGAFLLQLKNARRFNGEQAADGLHQIIWGLFKKLVVADNCALLTQNVFDHYKTMPAGSLLFGAFLAIIQLYADFSGYSDMAIGLSKMIGLEVTRNFNYPFFAQNIADYWRRWHISLTAWFTEYVFMPLAGRFRNYGKGGLIGAIIIDFAIIGIWHGANFTFLLFGLLNGCYYIPLILRGKLNKKPPTSKGLLPGFRELVNMAGTFLLVMLTVVVFRADSVTQALDYLRRLLSPTILSGFWISEHANIYITLAGIFVLFAFEWVQRDKAHPLQLDRISGAPLRAAIYYSIILFTLLCCASATNEFIYFKF